MPDVGEILASLAAHVATEDGEPDDEKVKAVAQQLRDHDNPSVKAIAQRLLTAGAGRGKGEWEKRVKTLEKELADEKKGAAELQEKLDNATTAPNEAVKRLEVERDKHKAAADKHKQELEAERQGRKTDRVGTRVENVLGSLRGEVDEDYLEDVLRVRIAKRLRPQEQGEGVEALDEDGTPLDGPDEKAQLQSLRASVLKVVPDKYRLRQMQPGGGAGRAGQGTVTREQIIAEKQRSRTYTAL